ncbi:glycerol-3-phosphate dehydrogenase/oxidase [Puniceicoccus vermicola]|uniref:glycerol-3-phosphate dehydrogenase n=1 Tax=Puniceicoccus vermicola TaxID=388746 RepID=A0A7X1AVV4_9BACT|nr:glycerol-3-phosphate dehydrogenase/oxidase [Puniceicoccus vermicola]MBC2600955.1 glycerol-3-phosphate dehydrogenase/oxidase [Puniceicoccus vermicola]
MNRDKAVEKIADSSEKWDFIIIGGGATGLGAAVDAASRGFRPLLLEQHDFTKGTSSRSTKLVHGGVRYLKQGNISLVLEALKERGLLCANAPHLAHDLAFVIPIYNWIDTPFYGVGLKVYDRMAGKLGLGHSKILSVEETLKRVPTVETDGLINGVVYHDAQFDDSRLGINLAETAVEQGATVANYMKVIGLLKKDDVVCGVRVRDEETGNEYEVEGGAVINATGVFVDNVLKMDNPEAKPIVAPSQGIHMVLPKSFLPGDTAVMVPKTKDGRVLFAVPWHDSVVVGTTDTSVKEISLEPRPLKEEIEFVFTHAQHYLRKDPEPSDVLSFFAGLRPLIKAGDDSNTAALSRDHSILISQTGLITIAGGKWTTYRKMAQDVIDQAETVASFDTKPCNTHHLQIHGWTQQKPKKFEHLSFYGSDASSIEELVAQDSSLGDPLHADLPYIKAEVIWATRHEMARSVEDVLARRTRSILLGAKASMEAAPEVARLMAGELGRDESWQKDQVSAYHDQAKGYLMPEGMSL